MSSSSLGSWKKYCFLSMILVLAGCGFKLRGIMDIPVWLNPVALVSEGDKVGAELLPALKSQLKTNRIAVVDPEKANYWIVILATGLNQQMFSVSASTTPRQYQFTFFVDFMVRTKQGKPIQKESRVAVSRIVTINEDRVLGSDSETRWILEEMYKDVSIQILNKLAVTKR